MPGFGIDPTRGPNPKSDSYRDHRFVLERFFTVTVFSWDPLIYVKSIDLPEKTVHPLEITTPGATYNFAKKVSYSDLAITFYATDGLIESLREIEDSVHTTSFGIRSWDRVGGYKGDVVVRLYKDGQADKSTKIIYQGCYLMSLKLGQVSYESSAIKTVTAVCKVDTVEYR